MDDVSFAMQMQRMISFLEEEGNELAETINEKTLGEAELLKSKLIVEQKMAIALAYQKTEEKMSKLYKSIQSQMRQRNRLQLMDLHRCIVFKIKQKVRAFFAEQETDRKILEKLLLEALFRILEKKVYLRTRAKDEKLLDEILPNTIKDYKEKTGFHLKVQVISESPLPEYLLGGVEVISHNGKIIVSNTLDGRIDRIFQQKEPFIRCKLFEMKSHPDPQYKRA